MSLIIGIVIVIIGFAIIKIGSKWLIEKKYRYDDKIRNETIKREKEMEKEVQNAKEKVEHRKPREPQNTYECVHFSNCMNKRTCNLAEAGCIPCRHKTTYWDWGWETNSAYRMNKRHGLSIGKIYYLNKQSGSFNYVMDNESKSANLRDFRIESENISEDCIVEISYNANTDTGAMILKDNNIALLGN